MHQGQCPARRFEGLLQRPASRAQLDRKVHRTNVRLPMVSATQQSSRIRQRKARSEGSKTKRYNRAHGTPAFPIHQEGYPASAADAKPVAEVKAAAPEKKKPAEKKK